MIDLTPLDVRNKRGDFKKIMRGYDPQEVDIFLEIAADRLEVLVRENLQLRERTQTLQSQVDAQSGREQAVQDALVTAQELRTEIQNQTRREAEHIIKEAEVEARQLLAEADAEVRSRLRGVERRLDQGRDALDDLERRRSRFLSEFKSLLAREMDVVSVEEGRAPLEERAIDLDLGTSRGEPARVHEAAPVETSELVEEAVMPEAAKEAPPAESSVGDASIAAVATLAAHPDLAGDSGVAAPGGETNGTPVQEGGGAEERIPEGDVSAVLADMQAPAPSVAAPVAEIAPETPAGEMALDTVDVADLHPELPPAATAKPEPGPSTLELELMAGAEHAGNQAAAQATSHQLRDVPDLETVLAEAGVEEVRPPADEEIAPPPAQGIARDNLMMFDPDADDAKY